MNCLQSNVVIVCKYFRNNERKTSRFPFQNFTRIEVTEQAKKKFVQRKNWISASKQKKLLNEDPRALATCLRIGLSSRRRLLVRMKN